jgi:hypothetical protein
VVVCSTDPRDELVLALVRHLQDPGGSDLANLLSRRSLGRSGLLRASTHPRSGARGGDESRISCHDTEHGWFLAATKTICTPSWMRHPQLARIICLSKSTQALLTARLHKSWLEMAQTRRGRPANGSNLDVAVVTISQLRAGDPTARERPLLAPEMQLTGPRARPNEAFIASDLWESADARAILEAISWPRFGFSVVRQPRH